MRVFLSAGEASGDAYGAALVREMARLSPSPITFEGIGGNRMKWAGVELTSNSGEWGAISITQSVKVAPRVYAGVKKAQRHMAKGEKGLFVPIDFGFANIRLARMAKRLGWKVLYFVPPGSWRRDRQGGDLPQLTDAISTPFEWSAELLRNMGANAHWFGHPIKQLLRDAEKPTAPTDRIGVLPGSRTHELSENLPVIAAALKDAPETVEFALAPSVNRDEFQARWRALAPTRTGDVFTSADTSAVLRRARAAIVCSGTATLEAALTRCPMVVMYRVSRVMEIEAKIVGFKRPEFISLPNILLQRRAVPELIQEAATPEALRTNLRALMGDSSERAAQLAEFGELDCLLGPDDAITQTAVLALNVTSAPRR